VRPWVSILMTRYNETLRNLGIVAHVDAGKTTLSERILFYAGQIHRIGEVHEGRATLDHQAVEKAHGITVSAASARLDWGEVSINLVDTPGHVDFTIEVERSLRVLDGAILVLCGIAGVQPQTRTVVRQMRRHQLPFIAFINKMDRPGADASRVAAQLRKELGQSAALITVPWFEDETLGGILDVVTAELIRFEGDHGERLSRQPANTAQKPLVERARAELYECLAEVDEEIAQRFLEEAPFDTETIRTSIRRMTLARRFLPVLAGSAYRNIGVQPLLDAVGAFLPNPFQRQDSTPGGEDAPNEPTVAFVFHAEPTPHGAVAHVRLYRGAMKRGDALLTQSGQRVRVGRLLRRTAATAIAVDAAHAGDIVAMFGVDVPLGTTLSTRGTANLGGITIPEPVMGAALAVLDQTDHERLGEALRRFTVRDPSLRISHDPQTGELVLMGMGELHLEITLERLYDECGIRVAMGAPKVAYRETIGCEVTFDWLHKKQDGGRGQYARVVGRIEPTVESFVFDPQVRGGTIATVYLSACAQGFAEGCARGPLTGSPVTGVRVVLEDGQMHSEDSSDVAFRIAARDALKDAIARARPHVLEPLVSVEVLAPVRAFGAVQALLARRRGIVTESLGAGDHVAVRATVPLVEMFGFVTSLRSETQGEGTFTAEPAGYAPVPRGRA